MFYFKTLLLLIRALSQFLSCTRPNSSFSKNGSFFNGVRQFSLKGSSNLGKRVDGNFAKKLLEKPATAVTSAFSRYREALGLQIDAFLKRNSLFLIGAGGVIICALLWRLMFGIANTFVSLSEGMAKYGFLALSSAMVAFSERLNGYAFDQFSLIVVEGLYIRSRITINPDKVYRMAMTKLNTSAGILEVMGSERKGLVSVEVKKKKGQYDMRLLAVDIPMASGPDQRLFLIGDEEEYKVGGGLISELRDPVVKAMAASKEFDVLDQIEEEEDAERELQEAERKHREEVEKLEKGGS
ncbi:hypothetical protein OIU85_003373 [Salix viminalis]|uniref:ABC transmembrane type-1 domain-containing protein n=1 Tax=Salix viminalis TaxID=40686 RepID=A0A9Q0PZ17_SALVM|nr:hypothetical protein OIU85_003373 [Salix viminalis]